MANTPRKYDMDFKIQAIKFARDIGSKRAAEELGIPVQTIYGWNKQVRKGEIDIGKGAHSPSDGLTLNAEMISELRKTVKAQEKEIKRLKGENEFLTEASVFFCSEPSEVSKNERMKFIALKTEDGVKRGKISFYCRMLGVTREGFRKYLINRDKPWKYETLVELMKGIIEADECNDTYGSIRMHQALVYLYSKDMYIPSERTIYRIMKQAKAQAARSYKG